MIVGVDILTIMGCWICHHHQSNIDNLFCHEIMQFAYKMADDSKLHFFMVWPNFMLVRISGEFDHFRQLKFPFCSSKILGDCNSLQFM